MATVQDTVLEYVRKEVFPEQRIAYDTPLITGLGANSLTMAGVKTYLEKQYRIRIPDELATREAFDSVEKITNLLAKLGVR
jgi:acyl carrier protein